MSYYEANYYRNPGPHYGMTDIGEPVPGWGLLPNIAGGACVAVNGVEEYMNGMGAAAAVPMALVGPYRFKVLRHGWSVGPGGVKIFDPALYVDERFLTQGQAYVLVSQILATQPRVVDHLFVWRASRPAPKHPLCAWHANKLRQWVPEAGTSCSLISPPGPVSGYGAVMTVAPPGDRQFRPVDSEGTVGKIPWWGWVAGAAAVGAAVGVAQNRGMLRRVGLR